MNSPRRQRIFVLIDAGTVRGLFPSWDAAEAFADKHRIPLDHLLEFETTPDYPDHLHLLSASWGHGWSVIGRWSRKPPAWERPPLQIRLEHFHLRDGRFRLFRQKEFPWREGLLNALNPMAPDAALEAAGAPRKTPSLRPLPSPSIRTSPPPPEPAPAPVKPPLLKPLPPHPPAPPPAGVSAPPPPQSIPDSPPDSPEAAPEPTLPHAPTPASPPPPKAPLRRKRIWPLRLLLPVAALLPCWAAGLFLAFAPDTPSERILADINSLAQARVLPINPGFAYFDLKVDPVHQQRWVRSLNLRPIPFGDTVSLPQHHTLDTWPSARPIQRPPFLAEEVRQWWNLRQRNISYGFFLRSDDGSLLVLDLEGDLLFGWGHASTFRNLLN